MNAVIKEDIPASLRELCPQLTPTSLNLPAELPFDRWQEIGHVLAYGAGRLQWWIADWWAFGDHKYGERYQTAAALPFNAHTCETYASVARAFKETSRRLEVLSFSHHQLVAALDRARADALLKWCAEPVAAGGKPRSTRELQARLLPRVELKVTKVQPVGPGPRVEVKVTKVQPVERTAIKRPVEPEPTQQQDPAEPELPSVLKRVSDEVFNNTRGTLTADEYTLVQELIDDMNAEARAFCADHDVEEVIIYIHELGIQLPNTDALSRAIGRLEMTFEARLEDEEDEE
jgi:hypothetical protein